MSNLEKFDGSVQAEVSRRVPSDWDDYKVTYLGTIRDENLLHQTASSKLIHIMRDNVKTWYEISKVDEKTSGN